ncbi:MAG: PEP-CTERM sorting domain-containing protein [Phycisphaerae bacterium]|jgi:hypothetical protein
MKKILLLATILFVMVSAANATLFTDGLTAELVSGTLTVTADQDAADNHPGQAGWAMGYDAPGIFQIGTEVVYDAMGDLGAVLQWAGLEHGIDLATGWSGTAGYPEVEAGDWFSIGYTGEVGDVIDIYDYAVSDTVPIGSVTVTPEPMTIALLGLGGLLLRRRK